MGILLAFLEAPPLQDAEFARELMKKRKSSVADVCLVFYSFLDDAKPTKSPTEAAAALVKARRLPEGWDLESNASLGEVSYLICTTLGIKGGLTMRVFGNSSRYCYRECVAKRLVQANGPHSAVSGRDLLSIAGRIEDELEKRASKK
ncbi:MAG: hypothetical protein HYY17_13445 [Planctomycetes bacterium]|nr:hypothetical protein [Planctomycetota bacterium]